MSILETLNEELKQYESLSKKLGSVINFNGQYDPQHYFYLLGPLAENPYNSSKDRIWRKLAWMVKKGTNPLNIKNKQGRNPLEEFYQLNRQKVHDFQNPEIHYAHNFMNPECGYLHQANELRELFATILPTESLKPLQQTLHLWQNFMRQCDKLVDTERIAFIRLLKSVHLHPTQAPTEAQFYSAVIKKIEAEKSLCRRIRKHNASVLREVDKMHRPSSPFRGMSMPWQNCFAYRPLQQDPQQAFQDYLLTLQDLNEFSLTRSHAKKRLAQYHRFCQNSRNSVLLHQRRQNERCD